MAFLNDSIIDIVFSIVVVVVVVVVSIIIRLLHTAVTKATGYINHEKIKIHSYAKIQHMLKY